MRAISFERKLVDFDPLSLLCAELVKVRYADRLGIKHVSMSVLVRRALAALVQLTDALEAHKNDPRYLEKEKEILQAVRDGHPAGGIDRQTMAGIVGRLRDLTGNPALGKGWLK